MTGRLPTAEARIARARHAFSGQLSEFIAPQLLREGLSWDEIEAGADQAERDRIRYLLGCRIFGDPAWGAWPPRAKDVLKEVV